MIATPAQRPALSFTAVAILLALAFTVDRPIAMAIAQTDGTALRTALHWVTMLGKSDGYLLAGGLGGVGLWLAARRATSGERGHRLRRWAGYCGFLFAVVALSGIAVNLLKPLFGRARPRLLFRDEIYGFDWFRLGSDFASFPSGHTATAISVGVALSLIWPGRQYLFLGIFGTIALSRIGVNAHYLSDVIGGTALAYATTMALAGYAVRRGLPLSGYSGARPRCHG